MLPSHLKSSLPTREQPRTTNGARVSVGKFEPLLQLLLLRHRDPRALLGSLFLDIFAVSNQLTSSYKIVHYIKSDNQFPSILQNN